MNQREQTAQPRRPKRRRTPTPSKPASRRRRVPVDEGDGPTPADREAEAEEATRARVARYVGEDAEDPLQTYVDLGFLHTFYRKGNPKALLYCVVLCAQRKARVPPWALNALGETLMRHLCEGRRLEPMLYRRERGGRTGNLEQYALQRWIEVRVRHAVEAARFGGCRGKGAYEQARQHLADAGYNYTLRSIEDLYKKAKRFPVGWDDFQRDIEERLGLPVREFGRSNGT